MRPTKRERRAWRQTLASSGDLFVLNERGYLQLTPGGSEPIGQVEAAHLVFALQHERAVAVAQREATL